MFSLLVRNDFLSLCFDLSRIFVAGDDAKVKLFRVPQGGLTEIVDEPEIVIRGK